jgi:hypothetical protein
MGVGAPRGESSNFLRACNKTPIGTRRVCVLARIGQHFAAREIFLLLRSSTSFVNHATVLPCELAAQPCPGETKIMAYGVDRSPCDDGSLFRSHASEVVHFDDLSKRLILASQGV